MVAAFYTASGLLAYLAGANMVPVGAGYYEVGAGDDDCATELSRLEAELRYAVRALESLLLAYLMKACASELCHIDLAYGVGKTKLAQGLEQYRSGYYGTYKAPCPDCDPRGALRFLRLAYRVFADLKWPAYYGGKAWAAIAEAALGRLEARFVAAGQAVPAASEDRTGDRCGRCGKLYADAPGPKWAFRCGCPEGEDNGPACDIVRHCANAAVFVDYVLDLEHNTGSCLNKGWLKVDFTALHNFQDLKRNGSCLDWAGSSYARIVSRVRARTAPVWPAVTAEAKAEAAPCAKAEAPLVLDTIEVDTPKGSTYQVKVEASGGKYLVTAKHSGSGVVASMTGVAKTHEAAKEYATLLAGVAAGLGTSKAKEAAAKAKCKACGHVNLPSHPCDCNAPKDKGPGGDGDTPEYGTEAEYEAAKAEAEAPSGPALATAAEAKVAAMGASKKASDSAAFEDNEAEQSGGLSVTVVSKNGKHECTINAWNGYALDEAWGGKVELWVDGKHQTQVRLATWAAAKLLKAKLAAALYTGHWCHPLRATPHKVLALHWAQAKWEKTANGGCKATVSVPGSENVTVVVAPIPSGAKVLVLDPVSLTVLHKEYHTSVAGAKHEAEQLAWEISTGKQAVSGLNGDDVTW